MALRFRRARPDAPLDDRKALVDFNRSLALIVDPDALQASIAARLQELFRPDRIVLFELDSEREQFRPRVHLGVSGEDLQGVALRRRGHLAKWLQVNETCLVVGGEPGVYEYLGPDEQEILSKLKIRICAPLVSLNRLTGVIMLGSSRPDWALDGDQIELLKLLSGQCALAFENAILYREQRDRVQRLYRAERLAAAGQIAAGIAHDVRNPLTAIRSTVQYIAADFEQGSPKRALVDELLHEVDRIDGTVKGLLSLSRPASLERRPVDMEDVVEQALVLVAVQAERQGVRIERRYPGDPRPGRDATADRRSKATVLGERVELGHLIVNLVVNALQAMPEGGTLSVDVQESGGGSPAARWIVTEVSDTGAGIAPENIDRVFDPFFTTKRDGTGLGLAICHAVVERHEGEIDVKSRPGQGTTVTVRLPVI